MAFSIKLSCFFPFLVRLCQHTTTYVTSISNSVRGQHHVVNMGAIIMHLPCLSLVQNSSKKQNKKKIVSQTLFLGRFRVLVPSPGWPVTTLL